MIARGHEDATKRVTEEAANEKGGTRGSARGRLTTDLYATKTVGSTEAPLGALACSFCFILTGFVRGRFHRGLGIELFGDNFCLTDKEINDLLRL